MNNAIIFIRDEDERQLSKTPYLGGNLLLHAVKEVGLSKSSSLQTLITPLLLPLG